MKVEDGRIMPTDDFDDFVRDECELVTTNSQVREIYEQLKLIHESCLKFNKMCGLDTSSMIGLDVMADASKRVFTRSLGATESKFNSADLIKLAQNIRNYKPTKKAKGEIV